MRNITHSFDNNVHTITIDGVVTAVIRKQVPCELALFRGITLLAEVPETDLPSWGWFNGELGAIGGLKKMGLSEDEISKCATTSCGPRLWAFRAWCDKRGIAIPMADWFFYANEVMFQEDLKEV